LAYNDFISTQDLLAAIKEQLQQIRLEHVRAQNNIKKCPFDFTSSLLKDQFDAHELGIRKRLENIKAWKFRARVLKIAATFYNLIYEAILFLILGLRQSNVIYFYTYPLKLLLK